MTDVLNFNVYATMVRSAVLSTAYMLAAAVLVVALGFTLTAVPNTAVALFSGVTLLSAGVTALSALARRIPA
jgi:hypothetical protein